MCWFSIIVGVVFLIYAWFRQVFLSVWHLTTDCLSSVSSSAYWEVATESWSDIFYLILSMILLIATDINTIFLLFGVLLHIVWNGCWHRIQIGFCTCHAVKIDSIMGIPEKLDPGPQDPMKNQDPMKTQDPRRNQNPRRNQDPRSTRDPTRTQNSLMIQERPRNL